MAFNLMQFLGLLTRLLMVGSCPIVRSFSYRISQCFIPADKALTCYLHPGFLDTIRVSIARLFLAALIVSTIADSRTTASKSCTLRKMVHLQLIFISILTTVPSFGLVTNSYNKCCPSGQMFDNNLRCVDTSRHQTDRHIAHIKNSTTIFPCNGAQKFLLTTQIWNHNSVKRNLTRSVFCLESVTNGSWIIQICPLPIKMSKECDGIMTEVRYFGANIAMHMNLVDVTLCLIVVIVYSASSNLGRRTYSRSVVRHNACLLGLGCTLTILGVFTLCHRKLNDVLIVLLWLIIQFFTLASVFWLNVICLDMTLIITRFRWVVGAFDKNDGEENRQFVTYRIFAWGSALVPTVVAGVIELCPAESVPPALRTDYLKYEGELNVTVNMYFFFIPLITLFLNNISFLYTSYKIFTIQRSIATLNENQRSTLWKKYFLFLRLYLLMGAPWFFGPLMACLNDLWILRLCRIVQPVLWILMFITNGNMRRKIVEKLNCNANVNLHCVTDGV